MPESPTTTDELHSLVGDLRDWLPLALQADVAAFVADASKGFWRPLHAVEQRANMAEVRLTFVESAARLGLELSRTMAQMLADLRTRIASNGMLLGPKASPEVIRTLALKRPFLARLRQQLDAQLQAAYLRGTRDARASVRAARRTKIAAAAGDPPSVALVGASARRFFRAKSFYVTGVVEDDVLKRTRQVLLNALRQDKSNTQVLADLDRALGEYLPQTDAAGRVVNVPARLENIARTNTAEAINEGRWATFTDPDLQGFVTALRYTAVLDERTRENHRAWDGVTLAVDDPVWFGPPDERPPNGYQCRCTLVPVTANDQVELTPEDEIPSEPAADEGFK